jgi:GTP-binding protein
LIEGASQGAGLGLTFLRHVERTKLLVHLLDVSESPSRDPVTDFRTLNNELKAYDPSLPEKPQVLALNKMDLPSVRERAADVQRQFEKMGYRLYLVSGLTGEGIEELIEAVSGALEQVTSHGEGS